MEIRRREDEGGERRVGEIGYNSAIFRVDLGASEQCLVSFDDANPSMRV